MKGFFLGVVNFYRLSHSILLFGADPLPAGFALPNGYFRSISQFRAFVDDLGTDYG